MKKNLLDQFFFGSFQRQIIVGVAVVHAVMMALFIADLTMRQEKMLLNRQNEQTMALAQSLATSSATWLSASDIAGLQELVETARHSPDLAFALMTDTQGRVLAHTDRQKTGLVVTDMPKESNAKLLHSSTSLVDVAVPAMLGNRHVGWVRIGISGAATQQKQLEVVRDGILYALVAIIIGSITAWFMGKRLIGRLGAIQKTIDAVKAGENSSRTALSGTDEVALLAGEFDLMLDTLAEREESLKKSEDELSRINSGLEQAIAEHTMQLRAILDTLTVGVSCVIDRKIFWMNKAHCTLFGFTNEESAYMDTASFYVDRNDYLRLGKESPAVLAAGRSYETEAQMKRKDGTTFWCAIIGRAINPEDISVGSIWMLQDITERKAFESALQESKQRLDLALGSARMGAWSWDIVNNIRIFDPQVGTLLGISLDRFKGTPEEFYNAVHPDDRARLKEAAATSLKEHVAYEPEYRAVWPDGSIHHLVSRGSLTLDEAGNPIRLDGVLMDITERKTTEAKALQLASIVEHSEDAIIGKDLDGTITSWNRGACHLFGYTAEEVIGRTVLILFPPERAEEEVEIRSIILRGESVIQRESQRVRKDGSYVDVTFTISPIFDSKGNVVAASKIVRDITGQKQAERALRVSEERFRSMYDDSPDAYLIMELNDRGRISDCNKSAALMLRGTVEQIIGKTPDEVSPERQPDGRFSSEAAAVKIEECIAWGKNNFEWVHRRLDGEDFWAHVTISLITIEGRQVLFVSWRDISDRKRIEQELDNTIASLVSSNKELEQFAYVASHDLQEPLRKISSFTELLVGRYKGKLDDKAETYMRLITDGTTRMKGLINDLLSYSRIARSENEFVNVDTSRSVRQVLDDLAPVIEDANVEIICGALPTVKADPVQMEQLFQNLIGNAIKYHGVESPRVTIDAVRQDGFWLFTISDNGIGIAPEYFDKIFVIFQRLHKSSDYPGTGIGLAVCKRIVERHGGHIWVESAPDQGSSFCFTLPAMNQ